MVHSEWIVVKRYIIDKEECRKQGSHDKVDKIEDWQRERAAGRHVVENE